ncbi:MAG: hypothetical protein JXJ04_17595 [Spirochaetales bacterium]|nr:hypothetical protein [Spirochaetales bacterium]
MRKIGLFLTGWVALGFVLLLSSCPPGSGVTVTDPDLYPSSMFAPCYYNTDVPENQYWEESHSFVAGEEIRLAYNYCNLGMDPGNRNFSIKFYFSIDKVITGSDTLLTNEYYTYPLDPGLNGGYMTPQSSPGHSDMVIPSVAPGNYYIGYILDSENYLTELDEDNNTTPPEMVCQITVKDTTANSGGGAVKIVNSWGTSPSSTWENIHDGHYWVTYSTLKALKMPVYYYHNDTTAEYKPTVIVVFRVTHTVRNACLIKIGLGDPANPVMVKEFQARSGSTIISGAHPFPNNNMALDISEFAQSINSYNLFLSVTTASGAAAGTINLYEVRYYNGITGASITTITGGTGAFAGNDRTTNFTAATTDVLTVGQMAEILPTLRAAPGQVSFIEEFPDPYELQEDMEIIGVYEPGKNYNQIAYGQFGTGFIPPTLDEWKEMRKLRAVQADTSRATGLDQKIDHSVTQYFPPIGHQGDENSCTCFAVGYYTHTFMTAKEFNWDLSTTTYGGTYPGAPQSNTDKIMSPDFIYHQINGGVDKGSNSGIAFSLLTRMGCASWAEMPYDQDDHTSWPSEAAFIEATEYRGRNINRYFDYLHNGYFIIRDDSDINLLKQLLLDGYVVVTAIQATGVDSLFEYLDDNDVADESSMPVPDFNHAQTIVGFKDRDSWHKDAPDD